MNQDGLLAELCEVGAMAHIDRYFARLLAELGGGPVAQLCAGVASAMHRSGHACLPLDHCAGKPILELLDWTPPARDPQAPALASHLLEARLPPLEELQNSLAASPVVASGTCGQAKRPLVLDGDNLYLEHMFAAESKLARRLRQMARAATQDRAVPRDDIERWLRGGLHEDSAQALAAAKVAAQRRLCVVTGGPGTGKTTLAATLVALLVHFGLARPRRIGLAAPTGKAAARLQESFRAQLLDSGLIDKVPALSELTPVAGTIHRLLNRRGPALDLLLVDECSMVDMPLMARLLGALSDGVRLILLGDAEQLSSVEPGSVFSDLCAAGDDADSPLAPCIVRLEKNYRFGPESGIGRLAAAVGRGEEDSAIAVLKDNSDTIWEGLAGIAAFEKLATETAAEWAAHMADSSRDRAFPARRVLCAHRHGPFGVARFNRLVERRLRELGVIDLSDPFYPGRPIIVTRNDQATNLSNGDTGVVIRDSKGQRRVWFPDLPSYDADDSRRLVSPSRLPEHESFFALTVHRAQGSEYDEVVFVPGDPDSPVNTRELFYTAVTRARNKVVVRASEDAIAAAMRRRTSRATGLPERLGQSPQ